MFNCLILLTMLRHIKRDFAVKFFCVSLGKNNREKSRYLCNGMVDSETVLQTTELQDSLNAADCQRLNTTNARSM